MIYLLRLENITDISAIPNMDNIILVINDLKNLNKDYKNFYASIKSNFILELDGQEALKYLLDNDNFLSLIFHKHYYTINSYPLFMLSNSIPKTDIERLESRINNQGYLGIWKWINDGIVFSKQNSKSTFTVLSVEEIKSNPISALIPKSFIAVKNQSELENISSFLKEYLSKNADIEILYNKIVTLNNELKETTSQLNWTTKTLNNYTMYNEVLKVQLKNKRIINYGGKLANMIRRIPLLRKILRKIQN